MQNCSNCYDGCVQITSDRCVKYTGVDVPILGILKGDSLSYVEQALITFLTSTLDGSGIKIEIDEELYCELVSQYLQECSTVTALDLFKALVQAACNLQEQVDAVVADIATIEANYTVDCLEGVATGDGTHAIVQAIITKLCEIDVDLAALAVDLDVNYVKIADINSYIAEYLANSTTGNRYYSRMVPYCPIPYVGALIYFDATGAGITGTEWEQIYLCNGLNDTPDMRGRVPVGAIAGVPGGALNPTVDPTADPTFNPNYAVRGVAGANKITLSTTQIPSHTHTASTSSHSHFVSRLGEVSSAPDLTASNYVASASEDLTDQEYWLKGTSSVANVGLTSPTNASVTNGNTGGGAAHDNKQPVIASYFIMYIPS